MDSSSLDVFKSIVDAFLKDVLAKQVIVLNIGLTGRNSLACVIQEVRLDDLTRWP